MFALPPVSPALNRSKPNFAHKTTPSFGSVINVNALCENKRPADYFSRQAGYNFLDPRGWWPLSLIFGRGHKLLELFKQQAPRQLVSGFNTVEILKLKLMNPDDAAPDPNSLLLQTPQMASLTQMMGESLFSIDHLKQQVLAPNDPDFAQLPMAICDVRPLKPKGLKRLFPFMDKTVEFRLLTGQTAMEALQYFQDRKTIDGFKMPRSLGTLTLNYGQCSPQHALPPDDSEWVFMPKEGHFKPGR